MGKCINCGIDLQDGILCHECLNKTDDAIAKANVNLVFTSGTLCMFSNRLEFQTKNSKKDKTMLFSEIQDIEITMKNLIGFTYKNGKYDSFAFENETIAQKWNEALKELIALHKNIVPDEKSEKEPEPTITQEPIEESKTEEIGEEPVEEIPTKEKSPTKEKNLAEEKNSTEEKGTDISFLGGLSVKKIVVAAVIAIVIIVVLINIFGGSTSGGNAYYAELAAQNQMGSGFTVDEIDFKVVASKKDTKYIVKCTAKSKEAKNMYETVYGETTVYFAYAEGYGNQYQYAIAGSKKEAKDKIDW